MEKGWNLGGRTHTRFIPEEAHFRDQEGVLLSKAHLEEPGTSWASWGSLHRPAVGDWREAGGIIPPQLLSQILLPFLRTGAHLAWFPALVLRLEAPRSCGRGGASTSSPPPRG